VRNNRINDEERRLWVLNDEGLYRIWRLSRKPLKTFIRDNRAELTACIESYLNRPPAR
jgi:hypothetical protein